MDNEFAFIGECGFLKPVCNVVLSDIPTIVRSVCMEYVIVRSSHEMTQFLEGLDTLRIGSLLKTHQFTARDLGHLMLPIYSPLGSNRREEKEAIVLNWNDYLQDLEGRSYISTLVV